MSYHILVGQEFDVSLITNFTQLQTVSDASIRWLARDGSRREVNLISDMSIKRGKTGVEMVHVVTGSNQEWEGLVRWNVFRGFRGDIDVGVDVNVYEELKVSIA